MLDREVYEARNAEFYEQYKAGTLDIRCLSRLPARNPCRATRASQLDAWHDEFMRTQHPAHRAAGRASLVRRHLAGPALTAIVTATNSFVTGARSPREFGVRT